jgi:hypothetical protein
MQYSSKLLSWEVNNMDFKTFFIKKILMSYVIAVAGITAAIGIIGSIYAPDTVFGYQAFLSPFLFGLVAVIPSFVMFSKKELTVRQMFIRLVLHFLLLEACILLFAWLSGLITSTSIALSLALAVLIIDLTVHLIMWFNDKRTAAEMNSALEKLQNKE